MRVNSHAIFSKCSSLLVKTPKKSKSHSDRGHMRNLKQDISFFWRRIVTKHCRVLTYDETKGKIKLRDSLITWSQEVLRYLENIISPLLQGLGPLKLAGWWPMVQEATHEVTWSPDYSLLWCYMKNL